MAWWLVVGTGISETISSPGRAARLEVPHRRLGRVGGLIIWATTNAVNVTDGLDGLAAGSALMGFGAFTIIAYWAFRNPEIYATVVNPLDMGVLRRGLRRRLPRVPLVERRPGAHLHGRRRRARHRLGPGVLCADAQHARCCSPLICGINVMEAGSVAIQMGVFKASGRTKRLFRMSPIHHHFELIGWPETTVIIRFWLISAICVASALAIFIADFTAQVQP